MPKTCEIWHTLISKIANNSDDEDEHKSSDDEEVKIVSNEDMDPIEVHSPAPVTPSSSSYVWYIR